MDKMKEVIEYIENHLEEQIEYDTLSNIVGYSTFYFHRIFTMLFNLTIGEYIRYRRLSLAALLIKEEDLSIMEIAYRYQYQTPEGFTKAFKQFHDCSPLQMKKQGLKGNFLNKLEFEDIVVENNIYYSCKELPKFYLQTNMKAFINDDQHFIFDIQKLWKDIENDQSFIEQLSRHTPVVFKDTTCIAIDIKSDIENIYFKYGIAIEVTTSKEATIEIPASTWLVFPCIGPVNTRLYKMWKQIYYYFLKQSQWVPNYDFNLEVYYPGDKNRSDYKCNILVPVRRKEDV